ncbi:DUF1579 family protein [Actinoplanes sp. LDG1-06]|uniref:DUF1579 family protein n=2 Tax=Paractinoplanes ovalisporus TaxID=2810368 RepID=A0ABS2AJW7_9ACTN|nr:DUF1579 family protein [Actinoplanes ovalisporus]
MPPQPDPKLRQLDYLVGTWKMSGVTEEGPMGPPAQMGGTETFEWLEGGFFLVHRWEGYIDGPMGKMPDVGFEFFDYDPESGKFRSHYFSSFGPYHPEQSHYVGEFDGDKLVLVGPAKYVRELQADGTIKYDCDFPVGPDQWVPFMHAKLEKVSD